MRCLVIGHFGAPNLGDEAMLAGLVAMCPPHAVLTVSTDDPASFRRSYPRHRAVRRGLVSEVKSLRSCTGGVVFCGGTHLHDSFRGGRLIYHYLSLFRYLALFVLARVLGLPVHQVGVGAGPLRRRTARLLARLTVAASTTVACRDESSRLALQRIAPHRAITAGFDLAVLGIDSAIGEARPLVTKSTLGVSVGPITEGLLAESHWEDLAAALAKTEHRYDRIQIYIFAGQEPGSDRAAALLLQSRLTAMVEGVDVQVHDHPDDVDLTVRSIGQCRLLIACRFHSSVLAYAAGVPQVIIPYHDKSRHFADEVGLPESAILANVQGDTLLRLLEKVDASPREFIGTLPREVANQRASSSLGPVFAKRRPHV